LILKHLYDAYTMPYVMM